MTTIIRPQVTKDAGLVAIRKAALSVRLNTAEPSEECQHSEGRGQEGAQPEPSGECDTKDPAERDPEGEGNEEVILSGDRPPWPVEDEAAAALAGGDVDFPGVVDVVHAAA